MAEAIQQALDVPVVCTLSGEDLFLDQMVEPFKSESFGLISRGAASIDMSIALSRYYAAHAVNHFSLSPDRVRHIPLGIHVDEFPVQAEPPAGPFTIGFLARISPEKGLANLVDAFIELRRGGRDCRLRIAGHLTERDRPYWDAIRLHLDDAGLAEAYDYVGEVDRLGKFDFLTSLSAFSVPAVQHEPKGFYCVEAMACGIPIVQPGIGAFPEMIDATGGGMLYDPDSPGALAQALASLMDHPELRRQLATAAAAGVRTHHSSRRMAEHAWEIYERVTQARKGQHASQA
jgi:glycosyltransferase involved in cell wall biosynthesis